MTLKQVTTFWLKLIRMDAEFDESTIVMIESGIY